MTSSRSGVAIGFALEGDLVNSQFVLCSDTMVVFVGTLSGQRHGIAAKDFVAIVSAD